MIDRNNIKTLHAKLDAVLKKFAEDNGLVSGSSQVRFSSTDFKVTTSFSERDANPNAVDPRYLQDLRRRGWQLGLDEKMIGRTLVIPVRTGMKKYEFQGMRASKLCMKDVVDGKTYLFPDSYAAKVIAAV